MIIEMPGAMQRPALFYPPKCGLSVGNSKKSELPTDNRELLLTLHPFFENY